MKEANMNPTDQIAAVRKRIIKLTGEMPEYIEAEIDAIIKAAIEKAYEQGREDEYQEWIRWNYPIRAAHKEKKLPPDWNKGLPVITHLSKPKRKRSGAGGGQAEQRCLRCGVTHRVGSPHECQPAHASTKRHHYQAEDGFPCPCGKPIDHPIHIPRINP